MEVWRKSAKFDSNFTFHLSLPKNENRDKWIESLKQNNNQTVPPNVKSFRVCIKHFQNEDLSQGKKITLLNKNAVPYIFPRDSCVIIQF